MLKGLLPSKLENNGGLLSLQDQKAHIYESLLAFVLLSVSFAFILPDLFFLRLSPMGGHPDTIKDPMVSWAAFMPAFREFRYELFEHGNIFWSNMRGLGLPMLGNGVQGAPLFPLNLALIWLPDHLFWSVMPVLRVILIGLGAYLLSRHIFGLSLVASLCFAFLAGFNINVLRWINHPWQNGLLAGIWYTYFCCTICLNATAKRSKLAWHWLGLVLSVFGMITNGFPESSALAALLAFALFSGFLATNWSKFKPILFKAITLILFAHIVGLSVAAVQIFALLEFIDIGQAMELREGFISGTYRPEQRLPFLLAQFSYFWLTEDALRYLNFSIGLFGTFFLVRGLCLWLKVSQRPWIGIACLLTMALYITKSFGLSSLLEWLFANTPVLAQSHFPLYFSPLFYFGAAYFVALGVESYIKSFKEPPITRIVDLCVSCIAGLVVLTLCALNINQFMGFPWFGLIEFFFNDELRHFVWFLVGSGLLVTIQFFCLFDTLKSHSIGQKLSSPILLGALLILCLLFEMSITHFERHDPLDTWALGLERDLESTFDQAAQNAPVERHELRSNDRYGDFASYGIATVDNGVSAILPYDQRKIRMDLFSTRYSGYFPLDQTRRNWSWEAMSSNLAVVHTTPRVGIDWNSRTRDDDIQAEVLNWQAEMTVPRGQPFYLEGKIMGFFQHTEDIKPWINFLGENQDFWVEANISGYQHLNSNTDRARIVTHWRIRIPNEWLEENQYRITVRLSGGDALTYADTPSTVLSLTPLLKNTNSDSEYADLSNAELLAVSPTEKFHFFYNSDALPRAYIASKCQSSMSLEDTGLFLRETNAVLEGEVTLVDTANTELNCDDYSSDFRRISITDDSGSKLDIETIQGPALVMVNDYYYPGWRAKNTMSGENLDILKANGIFRAVYLPEQRDYQLQLSYKPDWLKIVYALLLLALFIVLSVWWYLGKVERQT